jgi:putative membrane protein
MSAVRAVFSILIMGFLGLASGGFLAFAELGIYMGLGILIILAVFFIVLIGFSVLFAYVYYKRFLWEITEADIHIYSGIIFKKQVHIPFQRVQSIDFNAGIVDRVLGLVKLKIETAGGASNKGVLIPALKLAEAEALRAEVFARKRVLSQDRSVAPRGVTSQGAAVRGGMVPGVAPQGAMVQGEAPPRFDPQTGGPLAAAQTFGAVDGFVREIGDEAAGLRGIFANDYQENAPVEYEYGLSVRELILTALSSDQLLVVFAVLLGIVGQVVGFLSSFVDWIDFGAIFDAAANRMLNSTALPTVIGIAVFIFVFALLMGVAGTAVSYGGFKARRRGGRIEVERGLLARQYKGVSAARVQAVEIRQGFIRRFMGYAEIKLLTIDSVDASSNQQNANAMQSGGLIVHPFVKLNRVEDILEHLAPEFNQRSAQTEFKRLPRVSLRRALIRRTLIPGLVCVACAVVITLVLWFFSVFGSAVGPILIALWSLVVALIALFLIGSILWYRHAAYAYNPVMLTIRKGSYGVVTTVIPRRKIQWGSARQNPFQRLSQVASISAVTAAGVGGTAIGLRDLALDEADRFIDWMRPHNRR